MTFHTVAADLLLRALTSHHETLHQTLNKDQEYLQKCDLNLLEFFLNSIKQILGFSTEEGKSAFSATEKGKKLIEAGIELLQFLTGAGQAGQSEGTENKTNKEAIFHNLIFPHLWLAESYLISRSCNHNNPVSLSSSSSSASSWSQFDHVIALSRSLLSSSSSSNAQQKDKQAGHSGEGMLARLVAAQQSIQQREREEEEKGKRKEAQVARVVTEEPEQVSDEDSDDSLDLGNPSICLGLGLVLMINAL